jgi:hypothetical protein
MAAHFGVGKAAVSLWRKDGPPVEELRRIVEWTAGAVTVEEMLQDIESRKQRNRAEPAQQGA